MRNITFIKYYFYCWLRYPQNYEAYLMNLNEKTHTWVLLQRLKIKAKIGLF